MTSFSIADHQFAAFQNEYERNQQPAEEDPSSVDDLYPLHQADFDSGTYRITKSGTYKIMEDITFDFNAGDLEAPNEGDLQWWPTSEQVAEYEGAGSNRDNYYL